MSPVGHNPRICRIDATHVADLIRIGEETNLSPWSADSYLEEIRNPKAIMLRLVSEENETIGFVVGRLVSGGSIEERCDAEIYNIAISTSYQGNGHGQTLLDKFLDEVELRGAHNVWLEVRESNARAIDLYSRNGFEKVQTRPNFYENPREAALLMRLRKLGK